MSIVENAEVLYSQFIAELTSDADETIYIVGSEVITINSTNNKIALSLQAAVQAIIALVIQLTIADSDKADSIRNQISSNMKWLNRKMKVIYIENSSNVTVTVSSVDIAVTLQFMLQILLSILAAVDIL
ncbi:spore coat protein [Bacillus gobiensis]|uniref:spore coat protein n=1 Tax=Bacillus gobiensis TaxID=1441095 RepID=UPI003D1A4F5D